MHPIEAKSPGCKYMCVGMCVAVLSVVTRDAQCGWPWHGSGWVTKVTLIEYNNVQSLGIRDRLKEDVEHIQLAKRKMQRAICNRKISHSHKYDQSKSAIYVCEFLPVCVCVCWLHNTEIKECKLICLGCYFGKVRERLVDGIKELVEK